MTRQDFCKGCRFYLASEDECSKAKMPINTLETCPRLDEVHICPKCGGRYFYTTAHIVQRWLVDDTVDFVSIDKECVDVAHAPDNEDLMKCIRCGCELPIGAMKAVFPPKQETT